MMLAKNPKDTRLADFKAQENLNIKLTAVCDVFDAQAEIALDSFNSDDNKIKRFRTHTELIHSGEVDAIVIATPDHWHAPMAIEALNAGVHVYVEKPMTHNISETYTLTGNGSKKSKNSFCSWTPTSSDTKLFDRAGYHQKKYSGTCITG